MVPFLFSIPSHITSHTKFHGLLNTSNIRKQIIRIETRACKAQNGEVQQSEHVVKGSDIATMRLVMRSALLILGIVCCGLMMRKVFSLCITKSF